MRASRIFLAFQDLRSDRDAQTSSAACLSLFKPPLKYHSLSKMRVHMAKVRMAMKISTLPPWFKKALMAANASIIASMVYLLLARSEEHTSELQSRGQLVCRLLLEKKK